MVEPASPLRVSGAGSVRLICFPFAGGNASTFRAWPAISGVTVHPVELPGRQARFGEPAHRRMEDLVASLLAELAPWLVLPYALFGHSMGALVAYALAMELRRLGRPQPGHLLLSGRAPPHVPVPGPRLHRLTDGALLRRLLPGMRTAEDRALLDVMLPTLRADVELAETYAPLRETALAIPITAFAGANDPAVSNAALAAWRACTSAPFAMRRFPGGHQYLVEQAPALAAAIGEVLCQTGPRPDPVHSFDARETVR